MPEARGSKITSAAAILGAWGLIETCILAWAIFTKTAFAGGSLLYVWCAFKLNKRNPKIYSRLLVGSKIYSALFVSGFVVSACQIVYFLMASRTMVLKTSFPQSEYLMLIVYLAVGPAVCCALLYLLGHPDARKEMGLPETGGEPRACFVPKKHLAMILAGALVGCIVIGGPHLVKNPFAELTAAVAASSEIGTNIGKPQQMVLKDFSENNWIIYTTWAVFGASGHKDYSITIDAKHHAHILPSEQSTALR